MKESSKIRFIISLSPYQSSSWWRRGSFFLVVGMILLFSSCFLPEELPPEPEIKFERYTLVKDTLEPKLGSISHFIKLTISFTDGDGDIGLAEGDTLPQPYYDNNLFINNIGYRIPDITPTGQNKTLTGEIDVEIWIIPASLYDTIVYEIYLVDRALNQSNIVMAPAIVLNN